MCVYIRIRIRTRTAVRTPPVPRQRATLPTYPELNTQRKAPTVWRDPLYGGPARKSHGDRGARRKAHKWPRIGTAPVMGSKCGGNPNATAACTTHTRTCVHRRPARTVGQCHPRRLPVPSTTWRNRRPRAKTYNPAHRPVQQHRPPYAPWVGVLASTTTASESRALLVQAQRTHRRIHAKGVQAAKPR